MKLPRLPELPGVPLRLPWRRRGGGLPFGEVYEYSEELVLENCPDILHTVRVKAFFDALAVAPLDHVEREGDRVVLVYRIGLLRKTRTVLHIKRRRGRVEVEGYGFYNIRLVLECTGRNTLKVWVLISGDALKGLTGEDVEAMLREAVAVLAWRIGARHRAQEHAAGPPRLLRPPGGRCGRLLTAGLPVDVIASYKLLYTPPAGARLVEEGEGDIWLLPYRRWSEEKLLAQLLHGEIIVEVLYLGDRVAVTYRDPGIEAAGTQALLLASELCKPELRIRYRVYRVEGLERYLADSGDEGLEHSGETAGSRGLAGGVDS